MQLVGVGELPQGSCHLQLIHLLHPLVHSGQWLHIHQLRHESQRLHRNCQHLDLIVLGVPRSHQADLRMVHPLHSIPLGIHHIVTITIAFLIGIGIVGCLVGTFTILGSFGTSISLTRLPILLWGR